MSYASKFLNAKTVTNDSSAPSGPVFNTGAPTTQSSLFGRRPQQKVASRLDTEAIASNPWAAKAAAANGIKIEEKLNFESEKQFPTLGAVASVQKKGAWGSGTTTAAALAADWAAKDAEEKAAIQAEKERREEEAARLAEQRRQYSTFTPNRSDVFRQEVYQDNYEDDDYYEQPEDEYEEQTYEAHPEEAQTEEGWQQSSSSW